jgi:glycosyltransferase involved in cell wall biosynthesis
MKSVVTLSMDNLYYGNTAAVVRMNLYARALALADVNVYLISTYALATKKDWIEVEPRIFTLPMDRIKSGKGYNLFYVLSLVRELKSRVKSIKGELVVLNYSNTSSLLLDFVILLFFNKKLRIWGEVNEVRRYSSSLGETIRGRIYSSVLEKTYKLYNGLVFISRNIQDYYTSTVRKSVVVPILSDCDQPLVYSKGLNTLDIVFVGSVSFPKENLEELFEGFLLFSKEHPESRLHLYGSITDYNKKRLDEFVVRTNTAETIQYHGAIPHDKVREVLSSAGALVLPRTNNRQNYYGFSTKLSEYAVSGAPIILTNTGVVAEYFKDKENCLMCDGYDRESFRTKFEELAQMSHVEKQEMAENAYIVAKKWFDYRIYSDKLTTALFEE